MKLSFCHTYFFRSIILVTSWLSYIHCGVLMQQAMYKTVVDYWESRGCQLEPEMGHLGVITALKKICNHPSLVRPRQSEPLPGEVHSDTVYWNKYFVTLQ